MIPCSWKESFGVNCPTCGFQRGMDHLIHGRPIDSIEIFPAGIPLLFLFIFVALHLRFHFENGTTWIVRLFVLCIILIVGNYTYSLLS